MSYYETVEDIESEEEVEEEDEIEEIVPKRRKQKKWKVRRIYCEAAGVVNLDLMTTRIFDFTNTTMAITILYTGS